MSQVVSFNSQIVAGTKLATSVTTSEADLLIITDQKFLEKTQATFYYNLALGSATKVEFKYYVSPDDSGTTWYHIPTQDPTTNILVNTANAVIDSTTYSTGGNSLAIHDNPISSCRRLKITGKATTATATLNSLAVLVRDN